MASLFERFPLSSAPHIHQSTCAVLVHLSEQIDDWEIYFDLSVSDFDCDSWPGQGQKYCFLLFPFNTRGGGGEEEGGGGRSLHDGVPSFHMVWVGSMKEVEEREYFFPRQMIPMAYVWMIPFFPPSLF